MGKNRQAQRTKNNAQPSNSSRSAELLGTAVPTFVGFSAVKDGGYVPILPGLSLCSNDVEMNSVDSTFQVVLKKMSKKDATTKCKALQEFAALCRADAELSAVESMLPFWPRLYCTLAIDIDHRVREVAQLAHAALVGRVGKGVAMYLKQLAGTWFTSQFDAYPLAASAAANSFKSTFPPSKTVHAIVHCQSEILMYISDNITVQTAQTLSAQKFLTNEEMEARYERVLAANLQAYSSYLRQVPSREIDKTAEIHGQILSSPRFWKLARHEALPIKTAFFGALTSVLENAEKLLENEKKRTVTTIMNSLDESEPGLLSAVWESMLLATTKISDWHRVVNIEKLVLPKLWRVLRSGGQGCASTVYPNLLPFVSHFPKLCANVGDLYASFFDNMRQGFSAKSVQASRSEAQAVAVSFVECLRYSVLVNAENVELCVRLFREQLAPVLRTACVTDGVFMRQVCFAEIAHLARHWSKNRSSKEHKSYVALTREFWAELRLLSERLVNAPRDTASSCDANATDSLIEFLLTLRNAPDRTRKKLKVKFSNPDDSETRVVDAGRPSETPVVDACTDASFSSELREFISALCTIYFNRINDRRSAECIGQLNALLRHFASRELFATLSPFFELDKDFFEFYERSLMPLVLQNSEAMRHGLELTFYFMPYISDEEKDKILRSLIELNDIAITRNVIYCCLSMCDRNDPMIKKWYTKDSVIDLLIYVAREIAEYGDSAGSDFIKSSSDLEKSQDLILLAFETSETGELLISEEGADKIVSVLCDSLLRSNGVCDARFVEFVAKLMTSMWSHERTIPNAVLILKTVFDLCTREHDNVTTETLRGCCKEGFARSSRLLSRDKFHDLVESCAVAVWDKLYNNACASHVKDALVDWATDIFEVLIAGNNDDVEEAVLLFLTARDIRARVAEVTADVIYGEIVTGNLYVTNLERKIRIFEDREPVILDITARKTAIRNNAASCLLWALFTTDLLNNLHERLRGPGVKDSTKEENPEEDLNLLPGIAEVLINVMYVASVGEIWSKHYKSTRHYSNVSEHLDSLTGSFATLREYYATSIRDDVRARLRANRSSYGYMLPYIIRAYCEFESMTESEIAQYYEDTEASDAEEHEEARVQASQILGDRWNVEASSTSNVTHASVVARTALCRQNVPHETVTSVAKQCLARIMSLHNDDPALLLQDHEVSDVPWSRLLLPLEAARLLTTLVEKAPSALESEHWDFILISLAAWQQSIKKSSPDYTDVRATALMTAIGQLYHSLRTLMNRHEQKPIPELPPALLDEWKNVFAGCVQSDIVRTWMHCVDFYVDHSPVAASVRPTVLLDHLGRTISVLDGSALFRAEDENAVNFDSMLQLSLELLRFSVPSIQLGAYHALRCMVSELGRRDTEIAESDNFEPSSLNFKKLEDVLLNTQIIVNTMLMDFKLCDTVSCAIKPFTDSYTCTLGYLLTWAVVLDMCKYAHGDLRYHYAEMVKNNLFPCLLNNIFKLMPMEVLQDNKNKNVKLLKMFTTDPSLDFGESWTEWRLDHIVCWVYTNCLRRLPVLVRQWLNTADSKVSATVDKITSYYVSPMLCQESLCDKRLTRCENLQVKVHQTAREIEGLYEMEDAKLGLLIVLPPNYPLGAIEVVQDNACGTNFTGYLSQLAIFLTHQNGDIWEGLLMWKRNLDKKFAGVEECYICFSIFHINTYQIPKLSCHTCRKKFHTPCLYKWFNTSQKSTCPICRNVF